jgi:hypothetical protein
VCEVVDWIQTQDSVAGPCERGDEHSGSIKSRECFGQLSDYFITLTNCMSEKAVSCFILGGKPYGVEWNEI